MQNVPERLRVSRDEEHNGLRANMPGVDISNGQSRGALQLLDITERY